jgi:dihydroflavonol-4-reductase
MVAYADTMLNVVDVDDVAEGHVLALERGKSGHNYILGGENMTMRECAACSRSSPGSRRRASCCPRA